MTSFVRVNHKVKKTMAKPVIMVTRNIGPDPHRDIPAINSLKQGSLG